MWRIRVLGWLSVVLPPMVIVRVEAGRAGLAGIGVDSRVSVCRGHEDSVINAHALAVI